MRTRSSWLVVSALAISDDLGKFATGGLDALVGTETR